MTQVNDQQIEKEIKAQGLTTPRVTPKHIKDNTALAFEPKPECFK